MLSFFKYVYTYSLVPCENDVYFEVRKKLRVITTHKRCVLTLKTIYERINNCIRSYNTPAIIPTFYTTTNTPLSSKKKLCI